MTELPLHPSYVWTMDCHLLGLQSMKYKRRGSIYLLFHKGINSRRKALPLRESECG